MPLTPGIAVEKVEVEDREPLPQALKKAGEEASQTEPLRLEEEEVEEVEEASPTEQPAEDYVKEVVFPLGDHLVAETPDSTGETTTLTCVKCGLTAPLTDSEKMAKTECKQQDIKAEQEANKETEQQQKPKCITCGRPATTAAPFWDVVTMDIQMKNVCWECHGDFLKLLRKGPEIRPRVYGRGRGYYFQPLNTWFEEMAGTWPCPACEEFFDSFADVVKHFAGKHPDRAGPLEETLIDVDGKRVKAYRCWQGLYCPCGYLTDNENHFRHHYRREHPEAMR